MTDPWVPPGSGAAATPLPPVGQERDAAGAMRPDRRSARWVLAAALAVLSAAVLSAVALRGSASGPTPAEALEAWIDAAAGGDAAALALAVAPSQRSAVDPANPTGLPVRRLRVHDLQLDRDLDRGSLAPDEALVEVRYGVVCPGGGRPDARGRAPSSCRRLVGSGEGARALTVREQGRWWAVARPFRLGPLPSGPTGPRAVIQQRLVLTGAVAADVSEERSVFGLRCAGLELGPYDVSSLEDGIRLDVGSRDAAGAVARRRVAPDDASLSVDIRRQWRPRGSVSLERDRAGARGRLVIEGWRSDPVFDTPPEGPVSGELTWTCRDVG